MTSSVRAADPWRCIVAFRVFRGRGSGFLELRELLAFVRLQEGPADGGGGGGSVVVGERSIGEAEVRAQRRSARRAAA